MYPLIMKSSQTSRIFQYFSNPRKFLIVNKSSPRFIDFSTVCNTAILQLIENHLSNVWKPHNHIVCHQTLGCEKLYCVAHAHPHFNNWSARTSAPHLNFWWSHLHSHSHFFKNKIVLYSSTIFFFYLIENVLSC